MTDDALEFENTTGRERLDKLVQSYLPELSRAQIQTLIKEGAVLVEGKTLKPGVKLRGGETIHITLPEDDDPVITPEDLPLTIVYEDDCVVVVDKAAGMVVHPGAGNEHGTLINGLLGKYPDMIDMQDDPDAENRMGIVHRLDKQTSGLIVAARDTATMRGLMAQFQERTVDKYYLALLEKTPETHTGLIDAPIARDPKQRKRMSVQHDGREARTEFEIIDNNFRDDRVLVRLKLLTGRTHQIRVHMAFIKCPIVGDSVYGYRRQRVGLKRQFLHASELAFTHPHTEERLHFSSELPVGLQNTLEKLR